MEEKFKRIEEKVIDTHLHIEDWERRNESFIVGFDEYIKSMNVDKVNIASLPSGTRNVSNNIMIAFYKIANKNAFAHGGLIYPEYPIPEKLPDGMDFVTQYRELMEIGFDGMKMLEGKPTLHKIIGRDLNNKYFDDFYTELEKDKTHLIFHVNDPDEFWDGTKVSQELKDRGWFYGDGTYESYDGMYEQIYKILEKHPTLCVNFAHFFFKSKRPQDLEMLFEKYPNVGVDITPGGEMYVSFDNNYDYYRNFFIKYSERIQLGTDTTFPYDTKDFQWLLDRVYRYIATDDTFKGFEDRIHKGFNLPKEARENILYKNFERTVGKEPKEINKAALRRYIEKYKQLMTEEENQRVEELCKKYL